jgi:hypothetical protein
MTRILAAAFVALVVSGPAWGEDDAILLHCAGNYIGKDGVVKSQGVYNILIARDGSWIEHHSFSFGRADRSVSRPRHWVYRPNRQLPGIERIIYFKRRLLTISLEHKYEGEDMYSFEASCVPIENPFEKAIR